MIRGPYCTGAVTPSGASAFVSRPQPHSRVSIRCSVVFAFTGGMSMTWRRSTAVASPPFRDFPQQPHVAGRCRTLLSGWSVSSIVAPGWPFGRPGFRPDFPRSDLGAGFASPSDDGGFDEFREFDFTCAARSSTCACNAASDSAAPRSPSSAPSGPRSPHLVPPAAPAVARSQHEAPQQYRGRQAPRARAETTPRPAQPANRRPSNPMQSGTTSW